ncbi:MAG: zinc ribbon domain-containing protein [Bacteroidota bacterium]
MHCKHCGNQIENDSNFCSVCGGKVNPIEQSAFAQPLHKDLATPQQNTNLQIDRKLEEVFGIEISKPVIGIYMLWFLLHLILLLSNWNTIDYANKYFWPFSKYSQISDTKYYDLTEFFSYTIVPLIIIIIINLFRKPKAIRDEEFETKYDHTYERDFSPTMFGILLLFASGFTNILMNDIDKYEMKEMKIFAIYLISFVTRIITCIWFKNAAKNLNRDSSVWAFFGFATPTITLIVFGFKRKLKITNQFNQDAHAIEQSFIENKGENKEGNNQYAFLEYGIPVAMIIVLILALLFKMLNSK